MTADRLSSLDILQCRITKLANTSILFFFKLRHEIYACSVHGLLVTSHLIFITYQYYYTHATYTGIFASILRSFSFCNTSFPDRFMSFRKHLNRGGKRYHTRTIGVKYRIACMTEVIHHAHAAWRLVVQCMLHKCPLKWCTYFRCTDVLAVLTPYFVSLPPHNLGCPRLLQRSVSN